jgi:hypothetical protein
MSDGGTCEWNSVKSTKGDDYTHVWKSMEELNAAHCNTKVDGSRTNESGAREQKRVTLAC